MPDEEQQRQIALSVRLATGATALPATHRPPDVNVDKMQIKITMCKELKDAHVSLAPLPALRHHDTGVSV